MHRALTVKQKGLFTVSAYIILCILLIDMQILVVQ